MASCPCMLCNTIPRRVDRPILNRCGRCNNSPNYGYICQHKMCHKRSNCSCDLCIMVIRRDNRLPLYLEHLNWHHAKLLHIIEKRTEEYLWNIMLSRIHNNSLKMSVFRRLREEDPAGIEVKCRCKGCVFGPNPWRCSWWYEYCCDDNVCVGRIPGVFPRPLQRCKNLKLYGLQYCEFCWPDVRRLQTFMSEGYGKDLPLDLKRMIFNYIRGDIFFISKKLHDFQ
jgi:hypothetical protein